MSSCGEHLLSKVRHLRKVHNSENLLGYRHSSLHSGKLMASHSGTPDFPVFSKIQERLRRATGC